MKLFPSLSSRRRTEGVQPDSLRRATEPERRTSASMKPEELSDRADRLQELAVLSLFLHSAGSLEEMLAMFLERSPRVTRAVVSYPLLLDRRRDVLTAGALASVDDAGLEQVSLAANENFADLEYPLPMRGWLRGVLDSGEVALTDDLHRVLGEGLDREACERVRHQLEITKVAVVPLVMEGEAFGLCVFLFSHQEPDAEILELVSGHCTLALKAMMVGEEATRFGGVDPVTWAHSRGHFLEALEGEIVRARRFGRGVSLVLFDLDDFSNFNAAYGHTLGDKMLRAVAMTLAGAISQPEIVARYGGDEFVVMLPESHRARAVETTAAMMRGLESLSVFESEDREALGVSASVAIVCYPEDGSSREELLEAAEIAIEQAKQERRSGRQPARQLTPVQQLRLSGRRHTA